jgi:CheY-like chemotaxis protein
MTITQVPEQEEFIRLVHDALLHLYDIAYLQSHPLLQLLGFASEPDKHTRTHRARKMILDAIEANKPTRGVPASSPLWRSYAILQKRFIDGRSPSETMAQLGLGKSQFFLEQKRAVEMLATYLQTHLPGELKETGAQANLASETDRLVRDCTGEQVEVTEILLSIATLVAPLFDRSGIALEIKNTDLLTVDGSDRVLLRQSILVLLSFLAENRVCKNTQAALYDLGTRKGIRFTLQEPSQKVRADLEQMHGLETCRQLAESAGGHLSIHIEDSKSWTIHLEWTGGQDQILLVVDDNEETANLFRRYLACTSWKVAGASSVAKAQETIRQNHPTAVTIDILMPDQDGWELLTFLKNDPATCSIPVYICSVLNEHQLAKILGVAEYLSKPVSRDRLIQALHPIRRLH